MPCREVSVFGGVAASSGPFATEPECLQACKEGACCNGTTCSVKPQCQCNAAAGEVFRGIGTVCSPNPCPCTLGLNVRANPYDYSLGAGIGKLLEVSASTTRQCDSTESFSFTPQGIAAVFFASLSFSSGSWYCTIQTTFINSLPSFRTYFLTYQSTALQETSNGLPSAQTLTLSDFSLLQCLESSGLGSSPVSPCPPAEYPAPYNVADNTFPLFVQVLREHNPLP